MCSTLLPLAPFSTIQRTPSLSTSSDTASTNVFVVGTAGVQSVPTSGVGANCTLVVVRTCTDATSMVLSPLITSPNGNSENPRLPSPSSDLAPIISPADTSRRDHNASDHKAESYPPPSTPPRRRNHHQQEDDGRCKETSATRAEVETPPPRLPALLVFSPFQVVFPTMSDTSENVPFASSDISIGIAVTTKSITNASAKTRNSADPEASAGVNASLHGVSEDTHRPRQQLKSYQSPIFADCEEEEEKENLEGGYHHDQRSPGKRSVLGPCNNSNNVVPRSRMLYNALDNLNPGISPKERECKQPEQKSEHCLQQGRCQGSPDHDCIARVNTPTITNPHPNEFNTAAPQLQAVIKPHQRASGDFHNVGGPHRGTILQKDTSKLDDDLVEATEDDAKEDSQDSLHRALAEMRAEAAARRRTQTGGF